MSLALYRQKRALTLEQCAVELGLSAKSRGWLSEIERGVTDASLRLALRIERWSGGEVPAASVCREFADLHGANSIDEVRNLAPAGAAGAENPERNVSRTNEPGSSPEGAAA